MSPARLNRVMRGEIAKLRREGLVDAGTAAELMALYPAAGWNFAALGRAFVIFGAVTAAGGLFILGAEVFASQLGMLALALGVVIAGCALGSLRLRGRDLVWTKRSVELLGGLAVIGLTFTLGAIYGSDSGNWPALLLIDLAILLPLAYLLRNVLLLVLTAAVFFVWFGGATGYVSGWGAYWFGMSYPMRFLLAGLGMAGMSLIHRRAERDRLRAYEGFFKVWLSGGVFFAEMSLWIMALFGSSGGLGGAADDVDPAVFKLLWAAFNAALLVLGGRFGLRMLRAYAIAFLAIEGYTVYFMDIAPHLHWVLATFLAGAVTLAIVVYLERMRRAGGTRSAAPDQQGNALR